jgi:mono/diheme cytochrome c family protein
MPLRLNAFLAVILVVFLSGCGSPDFTDAESGTVEGKSIYNYYCTSCHGPNGDRGAGEAANLRVSSLGRDEVRQLILFGSKNGMAAYNSIIKEEAEVEALIDYVFTLRD